MAPGSRVVRALTREALAAAGGADVVKVAAEQMRGLFEFVSEFSRQILFDDLRDPKTGGPLYERVILPTGKMIRVRAHAPLELRHKEMESLRDRLGMPRSTTNVLKPDGDSLGAPIVFRAVGYPKPEPPQAETPVEPPAANGVAH